MTSTRDIAAANEAIISKGSYSAPDGGEVSIRDAVDAACRGTRSHTPEGTAQLLAELPPRPDADAGSPVETAVATAIEVTGESSMTAARRLAVTDGAPHVAVLNFASARNVGGGYLGGARAQEEDLCRVSALYRTLLEARDYYDAHRADKDARYSHRVIFSPDVPVFRDERCGFLDEPYAVSFLTSPAPNAGVLAERSNDQLTDLPDLVAERAARVLAVAVHHGVRTLVLGAWGCGVFRNDPAVVAAAFRRHLGAGGTFENRFDRVVFAVLDTSKDQANRRAFAAAFDAAATATTAVTPAA